ncbi:hypothetical protein ACQJBY_002357 [Aegilops geniculata]
MMEEPIEHHNCAEEDVKSSYVLERTTNDEEGFIDYDDVDADENEDEAKERKKRKLKYIWNLPKAKRIMVRCNDLDHPIGKEAKHLGDFLGFSLYHVKVHNKILQISLQKVWSQLYLCDATCRECLLLGLWTLTC